MKTSLSVIICTRNRKDDLFKCLDCLRKQTIFPEECIVIEDISEQQHLSSAKLKHFFQDTSIHCKYKSIKANSIAVSRNLGLSLATSKTLLYLDDDITFSSDLIKNYHSLHFSKPSALGFVGKILPMSSHPLAEFGSWYGCRSLLTKKTMVKLKYYPSLTLSLNSKIIRKHRMTFDVKLAQTCEDVDFLIRLTQKGESLFFSPKIVTYHNFRTNFFRFCWRYFEYAQNFAVIADRYPKDFNIRNYMPTRKMNWLFFPIFCVQQAYFLTTLEYKNEKLPKRLFWIGVLVHLCHFAGIIYSGEGRNLLRENFVKIWNKGKIKKHD